MRASGEITPFWQEIIGQAYCSDVDEFSISYDDIRMRSKEYVSELWQDAKRVGKAPILIFGESHVDKRSLIWQIALLAAMRNVSRTEGTDFLYCVEDSEGHQKSEIEYKSFTIEKNPKIAGDIAASLGAKIIPIDEEKRGGGIDSSADSLVLRDHGMVSRLRKLDAPAFVTVGYSHLPLPETGKYGAVVHFRTGTD